jgi:hypothetical protein
VLAQVNRGIELMNIRPDGFSSAREELKVTIARAAETDHNVRRENNFPGTAEQKTSADQYLIGKKRS